MRKKRAVFISYCHTNEDYKARVKLFASRLEGYGVDLIIDYRIPEGGDLDGHIDKISDSGTDKVIVLLDEGYYKHHDEKNRNLFVEAEKVRELLECGQDSKVIRVIMNKDETNRPYIPDFLKGMCIDLSGDNIEQWQKLCSRIFDNPNWESYCLYDSMTIDNDAFIITTDLRIETRPTNDFVGREQDIIAIKKKITDGDTGIVLSGMGGIGKTEICKAIYNQYIREYREGTAVPFNHIGYFQYDGSLDTTIANGMITDASETNRIELAWKKLSDFSKSGKLLLIIDNVFNESAQDESLRKLQTIQCSVLLTSRTRFFENFEYVQVGPLDEDSCKRLFEKRYNQTVCDSDKPLSEIIDVCAGRHTLTILLLGSIASSNHWTVQELKSKLDGEQFNLRFNSQGQESNLIEELVKLFSLANLNDNEKFILESFSLFPYHPLDLETCERWFNKPDVYSTTLLLDRLSEKGWLEINQQNVRMHPVISEVIQRQLTPSISNHLDLVKCLTVEINNENRMVLSINKLILLSIFGKSVAYKLYDEESYDLGLLFYELGYVFIQLLQLDESVDLIKSSIKIWDNIFGESNDSSLMAYFLLAHVYVNRAQFEKALDLYFDIIARRQKNNLSNPSAMSSLFNEIGSVYNELGNYKESLYYHKLSLPLVKETYGPNSLQMAQGYNNLGLVCFNVGDYFQSFEYHLKAYSIRTHHYQKNDIHISQSYENLSNIFLKLGHCDTAMACLNLSARIIKQIFGEKHWMTARNYHDVGLILKQEKQYDRAIDYYLLSISIMEEQPSILPEIAKYYNNLANCYELKGQITEASYYYYKALGYSKSNYGDNHHLTASIYHNIARIEMINNNISKSIEINKQALSIRLSNWGENHYQVALSYSALAKSYDLSGEPNKADECYLRSLAILQNTVGEGHQETASLYMTLAKKYEKEGKNRAAIYYYQKTYAAWEMIKGSGNPDLNQLKNVISDKIKRLSSCP